MANNSPQNLNLKIGKVLAEARLQSGLSLRQVEHATKTISAQTLASIEMGEASILCCDLHLLLELYSSVDEQLIFFSSISLKKEGTIYE